jgi:TolB-like protein
LSSKHPSAAPAGPRERAIVVAELDHLAKSRTFDGSPRQIRLLRFLVGEVLDGRGGELQAPFIATRFFGRPEGFDTAEDSIVRVELSKLRRALDRHYAAASAHAIRIELPRGRYAPVFVFAEERSSLSSMPPSGEWAVVPSDGPMVAVLPFTGVTAVSTDAFHAPAPDEPFSMGETPKPPPQALSLRSGAPGARSRALAHGLTDRLGALFARSAGVLVISHATTVGEAQARGARYVLEGAVRLLRGTLRVTAKLHDASRGLQVWGNTYDRVGADDRLFEIEDEIAREITLQVLALPFGVVHAIEAQERSARPAQSAYDVTLRFPRWFATFDPRLSAELKSASARALEGDPEDWVLLAFCSMFYSLIAWTRDGTPRDRSTAADLARRAATVEPSYTAPHHALAFALLDAGDGRGALAEAETGLAIGGEPAASGLLIALAGDWDRGTSVLRDRIRRMPRHPGALHHALALDAYRRGDHAAALAEAQAIATPHVAWDPLDRAVALAGLGRLDEARAAAKELAAILPAILVDPRAVLARLTADQALQAQLLEGLGLAGIG